MQAILYVVLTVVALICAAGLVRLLMEVGRAPNGHEDEQGFHAEREACKGEAAALTEKLTG